MQCYVNEKIIVISNPALAKIKTREIKEKKFLRGINACRRKVPERQIIEIV